MEQELVAMADWFVRFGACVIMLFFTCVFIFIVVYIICYILWLAHIYATIRARYRERLWWDDSEFDDNE